MKKMKLILNESLVSNKDSDIIEDTTIAQKPDYQIIDITVIPDETYYPTIQSILIDLDESSKLKESESNKLDINILSETVNTKTGYSNSLFEFESSNHTITLSLVLQESDRRGIYKVEAYTTRGVKVFESNTYRPKMVVESYLNSLANEYLIDKPLKEGYSLGDDKESFDVWDENNKKLEEIVDYVKQYADPKVASHIDDIEHSQDNISTACITLNGISDDVIGSNRDYDLYNELERNYPFINNIQAEHWYGKNICMVDFYIDGVYNKNKYGLCKVLNKVLDEFGDKKLNEAEDPIKDDVKEDLNIETGSDEEAMLDEIYNEPDKNEDFHNGWRDAEDEDLEETPEGYENRDDYSPEDFITALKMTNDIYDLNIDYSEWNNLDQDARIKLVTPELSRYLSKYKSRFDKNPKLFDLVQYNLTDANFHTEAKVLRDLYRGGE